METKNKNKIFFVNGRFCSNKHLKKFFSYTIGSTNHNRSKLNRIWSANFELGPFSCMRSSAKNHNCTITIMITDYNLHWKSWFWKNLLKRKNLLARSVLYLSTERPSGKFFHKIMWKMLTVGPISDLFWAQNLKFCSRDFFSKKTKNFAFFSFHRGERIFCQKSEFLMKTR